jgi:hypothetical protein
MGAIMPKVSKTKSHYRWLALLLSTMIGLVCVELGLRNVYRTLPSISALDGSEFRLEWLVDLSDDPDGSLCHEVESFLSHRSRWTGPDTDTEVYFSELHRVNMASEGEVTKFGSGETERTLWIGGDSLAYGLGVESQQSLGAHLSRSMASETGGSVYMRNLAVPGAGFCTVVQRVAGALHRQVPDIVMVVLSADDLDERLMLSVNGRLVAPPDLAESEVARRMVRRSWLANLVWFRWVSWSEAVGSKERRFIGEDTQKGFREAMAVLKKRVEGRGGRMVAAIVEPPGMPLCRGTTQEERCRWLRSDMQTMSGLLTEAGVQHKVVSGIWPGSLQDIVSREHAIAKRGLLAMHPSAEGHERISKALWPLLAGAM